MTTYFPEIVICGLCGHSFETHSLGSTSAFGSPDLDLRPPRLARWAFSSSIKVCPHCGYVANDLSDKPQDFVSEAWIKVQRETLQKFECKLAEDFLLKYTIEDKAKNSSEAFFSALHAAWALDDEKKEEAAAYCRKLALKHFPKLLAETKDKKRKENLLVMKSDLLRRSGQFEKVFDEYRECKFTVEILSKIIGFQLKMAAERDTACYTVKFALDSMG